MEQRKSNKGRRIRRYPWAFWFGQRKFSLFLGRDYVCMTHSMAQLVRNVAASPRYRLKVQINIVNDECIQVEVAGTPTFPQRTEQPCR